jgi:hypothetical protein
LYFADNIADAADAPIGLQMCYERYGMRVNLANTKVIVFRHGGYLKKYEKWFYQGKQSIKD